MQISLHYSTSSWFGYTKNIIEILRIYIDNKLHNNPLMRIYSFQEINKNCKILDKTGNKFNSNEFFFPAFKRKNDFKATKFCS